MADSENKSDIPAIGIDLGTSTSEIALYREPEPWLIPDPTSRTKNPIVPSVVAVNNKNELLVGEAALAWIAIPGRGIREVKRLMGTDRKVSLGNQQYRPEEISACILRHLKDIAQTSLHREIRDIVLSVPANFNDPQRQATRNAAELAGLNVTRLINEPTAAAMAYGVSHLETDEQVLVFDFGGGTLDITILEMFEGVLDVKASYGDTGLGGKDIDELTANLIQKKFRESHPDARISPQSRKDLKNIAEGAKIDLSTRRETLVRWSSFAVEEGMPVDLEEEISREEFKSAIGGVLDSARKTLQRAMDIKEVKPSAIDKVLLVGGSTWIPAMRELVADVVGTEPMTDVDPDRAVAMGASIQAAIIQGIIPAETGLIVTDVAPFGLGLRIAEQVGQKLRDDCYNPLIEPNTTIPYSISRKYSLIHERQRILKIELYQTRSTGIQYVHQTDYTGITGNLMDIPPSTTGRPHDVEVEFSYNTDGMIVLKAVIPGTDLEIKLNFNASGLRMSEEEMSFSRERLDDLFNATAPMGFSTAGIQSLIIKGEMMAKRIDDQDDLIKLKEYISNLRELMESGQNRDIEKAADDLTDFLYDLETRL